MWVAPCLDDEIDRHLPEAAAPKRALVVHFDDVCAHVGDDAEHVGQRARRIRDDDGHAGHAA